MKRIIYITLISFIFFMGTGIYYHSKSKAYSDQLIESLHEGYADSISVEEIQTYKTKIIEEIKIHSSRSKIQKSYYALALLEHLEKNYSQSNQYFYRILNLKQTLNPTLEILVYEGLAINSAALGEIDESYSHFKKAEKLVRQLGDSHLRGLLYNRYGYAILTYTDGVGVAITLLEHCLTLDIEEDIELNTLMFLSDSYLRIGFYDRAISYLINVFELAIARGEEDLHLQVLNDLAVAYYLNGNYESSINAFEQVVELKGYDNLYQNFYMMADAYRLAYGDEKANEYIQTYFESMNEHNNQNPETYEFLKNVNEIQLLLYEGNVEKAMPLIEILSKDESMNTPMIITYLTLWAQFNELVNTQVDEAIEVEALVLEYKALYEEVQALEYSKIKLLLLNIIMQESLALGDYELGYNYLERQKQMLSGIKPNFEPDTMKRINEKIIEEVDDSQDLHKRQKNAYVIIFGSASLILITGISLILIRYKRLKEEANERQRIQSVTETLTKRTLYACLEAHAEFGHDMTFILIDIDDFTRYNELYGYLQGEEVIKQLASILKGVFPKAYISRHHGECFILVLEGPKNQWLLSLKAVFNRVEELNIEYATNLKYNRVTVSAGVSGGNLTSKNDIDHYINQATYKLRASKQRGKNTFTL